MNVSPQEMMRRTKEWAKNIEKARNSSVAVGLPAENVGGKIYGDGESVISVGAAHEYGAGVPRRSFLRVPYQVQKDLIARTINQQFRDVAEKGKDPKRALGLVGTVAVDVSKGAFTSRGYGVWPDISQATKDAKGSSQVLIDTGTLRNSITYVVRS